MFGEFPRFSTLLEFDEWLPNPNPNSETEPEPEPFGFAACLSTM
jgi:hypothetical protein